MHNWREIDFLAKQFASTFNRFVLVVHCHLTVDTYSQNPH